MRCWEYFPCFSSSLFLGQRYFSDEKLPPPLLVQASMPRSVLSLCLFTPHTCEEHLCNLQNLAQVLTPSKSLSSLQAWWGLYHLYILCILPLGRLCQCSVFTHVPPLVDCERLVRLCLGQCLMRTEHAVEWMNAWMSRWLKTLVSSLF